VEHSGGISRRHRVEGAAASLPHHISAGQRTVRHGALAVPPIRGSKWGLSATSAGQWRKVGRRGLGDPRSGVSRGHDRRHESPGPRQHLHHRNEKTPERYLIFVRHRSGVWNCTSLTRPRRSRTGLSNVYSCSNRRRKRSSMREVKPPPLRPDLGLRLGPPAPEED
jgi:hypothetical protein